MIRLACFDLDGTLILGTTTSQFLAKKLGFFEETIKYEEEYRLGRINNIQVADWTAYQFKGISLETIKEITSDIPRIANIGPTVATLKKRSIIVVLASITWSFFVKMFAKEYGFDYYCGTEMKAHDNVLTGEIGLYCTEQEKLQFFLTICRSRDIPLTDTVAIGDSKSDHPIFRKAGKSIALNADTTTKRLATYSIDTNDLLDILPFFK